MPLLQHAAYDVASGAFAFTPDESQLGEQVFTAVANAVLLMGVAAFILYEAVERIGNAPEIPGVPMIVVALAGLLASGDVANDAPAVDQAELPLDGEADEPVPGSEAPVDPEVATGVANREPSLVDAPVAPGEGAIEPPSDDTALSRSPQDAPETPR